MHLLLLGEFSFCAQNSLEKCEFRFPALDGELHVLEVPFQSLVGAVLCVVHDES